METDLVVKSNKLILGRYEFSLAEQRIVIELISKIKKPDDCFREFELPVADYINLIDSRAHNEYQRFKDLADGMMKKTVFVDTDDGGFVAFNWFHRIRYQPEMGVLTCQFHEDMRPFLLKLRENFTAYQLENILRLRGKYSVRIYEILKSAAWKKCLEISLDELRETISIPQSYTYQKIKTQILNTAKKELKSTDINFTFTPIKRGRNVTRIRFKITESKQKLLDMGEPDSESTTDERVELSGADLLALVPQKHATAACKKIITTALKNHSPEYIAEKIKYTNQQKKISNYPGFLHNAITENYRCEDEIAAEKKRIKNEKRAAAECEKEAAERIESEKKFSDAEKIFDAKPSVERDKIIATLRKKNRFYSGMSDEILRGIAINEMANVC